MSSENSQIIKGLLFDIAYTWIGQDKDNCEEKRDEKLARFYYIERTTERFYFEFHLWNGISLGIDCNDHEMFEDWDEPRPPISKNADGKILKIVVSELTKYSSSNYMFNVSNLNLINRLPSKYRQLHTKHDDIDDVIDNIRKLRHHMFDDV